MTDTAIPLGNITLFGFTHNVEGFLKQRVEQRLGITPQTIDFGPAAHFFFYTSDGDVATSEEAMALRLGFIRSEEQTPRSAGQLLQQNQVTPEAISYDQLRGNGLVACFDKKSPQFSVYQTLIGFPTIFYSRIDEGIVCATGLRALLPLVDRVELNEEAVPTHFLFEMMPGTDTYFRDISRMYPGQLLQWRDGDLTVRRVKDLRPREGDPVYHTREAAFDALQTRMDQTMAAYIAQLEAASAGIANLLSGGVDSSILQLFINRHLPESKTPQSLTFAVNDAPSFEFEIGYARHASELFKTEHTFIDILPEDYPTYLTKTIEILGQPTLINEGQACYYGMMQQITQQRPDFGYFFNGQAADALHGASVVKKILLYDKSRKIPGARFGYQLLASLVGAIAPKKSDGFQEIATLIAEDNNPNSLLTPPKNTDIANFDWPRRFFGDEAILKALNKR
ncbi:MAG: asparagine synthase-related protein, partial [Chloroflexota bacterium]